MILLIIIYVFSKWVEVEVLTRCNAETMQQAFFKMIICMAYLWAFKWIRAMSSKVLLLWG